MRFLTVFLSFFALCCLHLEARRVVGVPKDLQATYSESTFRCLSAPQINFPSSLVNDGFCDCPDGSDEPGTAGCSFLPVSTPFYCENKGSSPVSLASSKVSDGFCDCCDGSDERKGKCPNICSTEGEKSREGRKERVVSLGKGLEKKREGIKKFQEEKNKLAKDLTTYKMLLKERKEKYEEALNRVKEEELKEDSEKKREEEQKVNEVLPEKVEEEKKGEEQQQKEEGQEAFPYPPEYQYKPEEKKEENFPYPPEYQYQEGEDAKEGENEDQETSFPYPAEYQYQEENKDEKEAYGEQEALSPEEMFDLQAKQEEEDQDKRAAARLAEQTRDGEEVEEDREDFFDRIETAIKRLLKDEEEEEKAAAIARSEAEKLRGKVSKMEEKVKNLESFFSKSFGPDDEYSLFLDSPSSPSALPSFGCFSLLDKQYEYEICPFGEAKQKEGKSHVSLGKFDSFAIENGKTSIKFQNGQGCWQGPKRSLTVSLQCGEENKVLSVDEASRCVYQMVMETPAVCSEEEKKRLEEQIKEFEDEQEGEQEEIYHTEL